MSEFIVYPAIDLRGGQVVRLKQGDPDRQITYEPSPGRAARRWIGEGARWLHVVNLDGAFGDRGRPHLAGLQPILSEAKKTGSRIQFGGGIRSLQDMEELFTLGVARVILGTAAARDPGFVQEAVTQYGPGSVAVGIDVRDGTVQVSGWTEGTDLAPIAYGRLLKGLGLEWAVYTDIHQDGMGRGLNIEASRRFQVESGLEVIAAGGAASLEDIQAARQAGLRGVIIGRALYTGEVKLVEALELARGAG